MLYRGGVAQGGEAGAQGPPPARVGGRGPDRGRHEVGKIRGNPSLT